MNHLVGYDHKRYWTFRREMTRHWAKKNMQNKLHNVQVTQWTKHYTFSALKSLGIWHVKILFQQFMGELWRNWPKLWWPQQHGRLKEIENCVSTCSDSCKKLSKQVMHQHHIKDRNTTPSGFSTLSLLCLCAIWINIIVSYYSNFIASPP